MKQKSKFLDPSPKLSPSQLYVNSISVFLSFGGARKIKVYLPFSLSFLLVSLSPRPSQKNYRVIRHVAKCWSDSWQVWAKWCQLFAKDSPNTWKMWQVLLIWVYLALLWFFDCLANFANGTSSRKLAMYIRITKLRSEFGMLSFPLLNFDLLKVNRPSALRFSYLWECSHERFPFSGC